LLSRAAIATTAAIGEFAAHHVVGIEIADHPAAAVKEHQARRKAAR
jgi:hypothetical protein